VSGEILFLAHRSPYPPDRGDKIRSWHLLRHIAAIAPTHVVALYDDPRDLDHLPVLEGVAASVELEPRQTGKARAAFNALLRGGSASVTAFASAAVQRHVDRLLATRPIKTIFAYSGQMAQFVPEKRGNTRFVMDFVDMDSAKFATYAAQASGLRAFANAQEAKRLFAFERAVAARADISLFVSEAEAALFAREARLSTEQVSFIENGIDLEAYDPANPRSAVSAGEGALIVFTGQMDYRPNVEAVEGFARNTLPLIRAQHPSARFAIVGRNLTAEVLALTSFPGVTVTGEVPDTRDWLAAADVVVAPLLLARGIQNKVLEAMAMAKPVVASPAAAEGIDAAEGDGLIVAQEWAAQANAVLALLTNPARAKALGRAARARMVARYSWDARLAGLGAMLGFCA
jgi:sugar transferase (PEP-CTERM/EpsH1 system associated)